MALPEFPPAISEHTAHGVTYKMWTSPDKIGRAFTAGTPYESAMLEWIWNWGERHTAPEIVALDVGANIGNHALWMARVCGFVVHAFEPVMPHVLNANVALNDCYETLIVWPWGLGAEQAEYHHTSKGVLKRGISRESTDERLTVVRLDDLVTAADIDTKVDLMKIDVEGMEVDVLKGGMATIERDRPVILTEEWKTETTQSIGKLIRRFGYSRTHAFGGKGKAPVGVWEAR